MNDLYLLPQPDVLDHSSGAHGTVDVSNPERVLQGLGNEALAAPSARHKCDQGRSNLSGRRPFDPVVDPEAACLPIPDDLGGRCAEELARFPVARELKMAPGAVRIRGLQP